MDPLSVAASILGILAAATKVVEILTPVVSSLTESTKNAAIICSRIESSRNVLSALQKLFTNLNAAPRKRKELIPIDHLIVALTNGVLLFSELEAMVLQLGTSTENFLTRIQWARKDKTFNVMISRLQGFEISISVMLNILQCESDSEAAISQKELYESNLEISQRLASLENALRIKDDVNTNIKRATDMWSSITSEALITQFEFEGDLESSRPYRKAQRASSDYSFRSSVVPSHAWSALSDISLSEISIVAVVALPISSNDITNGYHYQIQDIQMKVLEDQQVATSTSTPTELLSAFEFPPTQLPTHSPVDNTSKDNAVPLQNTKRVSNIKFTSENYCCVVLGGINTGKSELAAQFIQAPFIESYDPTIEDSYNKNCYIDGKPVHVEILDTSGTEQFLTMKDLYIKSGEGFWLVYSITSRHSFQELISLQQDILRVRHNDYVPMIIVGNRCERGTERVVTISEGLSLALQFNCPYLEVSTCDGRNVDEIFVELVREIRRHQTRTTEHLKPAKPRKRWLTRNKPDRQLDIVDENG